MIYMANYSSVDSVINAWVQRHALKLYTHYKDDEVRSVVVLGRNSLWQKITRKKFQIWIDRPEGDTVGVHMWDYRNKARDWKVDIGNLNEALEEAIQVTRSNK